MDLVLYGEPSGSTRPGHVALGQESDGVRYFVGFGFDLLDLPADVTTPADIRAYLFAHTLPGQVRDDSVFVRQLLATGGWWEKRAACGGDLAAELPPAGEWVGFARYSFNPDDFDTPDDRCFNCVTWAVGVSGRLLPGFLAPVRQGRMKLILQQLTNVRTPA